MDRDCAVESVELLARRVASVPGELTAAHFPALPDFGLFTKWVVTGLGASEAPARLLVGQLLEQGLVARFQPASAFLAASPPAAEVLVVVSQRLSPNGRIPLRHRHRYKAVVLVTSLDPGWDARCAALAAEGVTFLTHGPSEEDGLLLRVIGPALAARMVLHLAAGVASARGVAAPAWCTHVAALGPAMAHAASRAQPVDDAWVFGPTSILTAGGEADLAPGLRTKLLEALAVAEPPIWDLCGVVHGPLPSFFEQRRLLFVLEPANSPTVTFLRRRLEQILDRDRHHVRVLEATLPAPLSYFEYAAALDAILVQALRSRPHDLTDWPSKGRDGPIYAIDEDESLTP